MVIFDLRSGVMEAVGGQKTHLGGQKQMASELRFECSGNSIGFPVGKAASYVSTCIYLCRWSIPKST